MSDHSTRPISREVRIPSWVLAINLGPRRVGPEKLLLALWVHATWGAVGPVEVWPSVDALARDVGRPRSTVEKWLAVLVSEGLITRLEGRHGWLLAWAPPPAQEGDPPVQECPPTQADPPAQAEKTAHPGGSIRLHRSTEQDKNKPIQQKNPVAAIEVDPPPQEKKPPTQADPPAQADPRIAGDSALAVAAKHPIAWSAAMAPRWQQELREAVPILGLTPELVGWVLDEWGRQQAAGRERGTWDRDLAKGVVPALRGIWWARRRERAWLEAQLARRAAQLAPEAQADTPEDLGELRYSEDLAAVRLRLLGGGGVA